MSDYPLAHYEATTRLEGALAEIEELRSRAAQLFAADDNTPAGTLELIAMFRGEVQSMLNQREVELKQRRQQ